MRISLSLLGLLAVLVLVAMLAAKLMVGELPAPAGAAHVVQIVSESHRAAAAASLLP